MRLFPVLLLQAFAPLVHAQVDTLQVLTRKVLLELVSENHPVARQAYLRPDMGDAFVQTARGAFDPVVKAGYEEKDFAGKDYFDLLDAGLVVPTWFGVELYGGFQENGGEFLDPQNTTPSSGLVKAGISVPLGQGLFIDKRRAELRRSFAFRDMAEAERTALLNNVFHDALSDHLEWVAAYKQYLANEEALEAAEQRFNAVNGSFVGGDRPAIDTLEAFLQVQDRRMRLTRSALDLRNTALQLSNHLWDPYMRPLEISARVVPDTNDLTPPGPPQVLDTLMEFGMMMHPGLINAQAKVDQMDVERQYRGELLKPKLDLRYMLLGNGNALTDSPGPVFNGTDQQFGLGFSMPVLLRTERGALSLAKLRRMDAEYELDRQRLTVRNNIGQRNNELALYAEQVELGADMVNNYRRLLRGETNRFQAGESSLFLVNQREVAWLDVRIQQIAREAKLCKAHYTLEKEAGVLWRTVSNDTTSP